MDDKTQRLDKTTKNRWYKIQSMHTSLRTSESRRVLRLPLSIQRFHQSCYLYSACKYGMRMECDRAADRSHFPAYCIETGTVNNTCVISIVFNLICGSEVDKAIGSLVIS